MTSPVYEVRSRVVFAKVVAALQSDAHPMTTLHTIYQSAALRWRPAVVARYCSSSDSAVARSLALRAV